MAEIAKGLQGVKLHLVEDVETASKFLSWLGERRPHDAVGFDIETGERRGNDPKDALSPWRGQIRLAQIGDGMTGWAIPWEFWSGVFLQGMRKYTGKIICHNIAFEGKWMALQSDWDFPWHHAHDTMLMSRIISPTSPAGLKPLAERLVDYAAANAQGDLYATFAEHGWTWGTVPYNYQAYWVYSALDPVLTVRLFDQFWDDCGPGQKYHEAYELEMQVRRIANQMEMNGAPVDLDYSQDMVDRISAYTEGVKDWARKNYNGLSITSNVQLGRKFEELGAEITERTASGAKSVTKETLQRLAIGGNAQVSLLAEATLNQRQKDKLRSSYFENFIKDHIDGVLHPSINTMAARTSRMSITDPALQTLPKGDASVRRAFVTKSPDYGILSSDLDQVEFRLTASFSEDQKLLALFRAADEDGDDVFTQIMHQVYDDDTLVKKDPRRNLIKSTVYGKLYGAGVDKMALTSKVSTSQMQSVVDGFDSNYPGVKLFQKKIENLGMQRIRNEGEGYVVTKLGRRLPCDPSRVYSLTNYLIQGSAAEIFKQNLVRLDQADMTQYMIVPVHDEIVLQVPKNEAEEIKKIVRECMTTRDGWPIVLSADAEGPFDNWGAKYEH